MKKRRQYKGYRKKWLYYRCKEEGLLNEYYKLFGKDKKPEKPAETDSKIKFTFGKYKGRPVAEIWKLNRGYIDWVRENVNLSEYPDEEFAIDTLVDAE